MIFESCPIEICPDRTKHVVAIARRLPTLTVVNISEQDGLGGSSWELAATLQIIVESCPDRTTANTLPTPLSRARQTTP